MILNQDGRQISCFRFKPTKLSSLLRPKTDVWPGSQISLLKAVQHLLYTDMNKLIF